MYSLGYARIKWVVLILSPHKLPWLNPERNKQNNKACMWKKVSRKGKVDGVGR